MKKYNLTIVLLLAGLLFIWVSCSGKSATDGQADHHSNDTTYVVRPVVIFATADGRPLYHYVESQGVVRANRRIKLMAQISGFVRESHIIDGRRVHKGDTLLVFRQKEWRYALQKAKNQYQQALATYHLKKRMRYGGGSDDTTHSVDPKLIRLRRINAGLAGAKVALKQARLDLAHTVITAPFSGQIAADRRFTEGAYVPAGTPLGQLVDAASVRIRFSVLADELSMIHKGMKVKIAAPGGQTLEGTIIAVSPVVDTRSKVGTVTARVDNPQRLLYPGMIVSGHILVNKVAGKARIPRSAILTRHGRQLVFKLKPATNTVQWIYVHPVAVNSRWAIVDNPKIAPGDTLAVDNNFSLSHLQKVRPKMRLLQRKEHTGLEETK